MTAVVISVFDSEAGTTTEYSFKKSPVRIGRNPLNDLTLPFPFVSGWHAVVRFGEGAVKFFDLGSTNGTLHNGRRIQAGEAVDVVGTLSLTIGKLELSIKEAAPDRSSPPPSAPMQRDYAGAYLPTGEMPAQPAPVTSPPVANPGAQPQPPTAAPNVGAMVQKPATPVSPAPAPSPGGAPHGSTAHVEMSDVHQLVSRMRPLHQGYRQSWKALVKDLTATLESMQPPMRPFALSILQREFPELANEPEFVRLSNDNGHTIAAPSQGGGGGTGDVSVVASVARSLSPDAGPPGNAQEAQKFLSCVEDVLRASARAFVELQKGQEQFGNEMGVRTIKEYTALHAAGTPENVLKYLLDWKNGGPHRTQELVGVYADLMIHQVALINGLMEGVRSLLARLAPEEIERRVTAGWPTRAAAVWKQYTEKHRELSSEDQSIMSVVFGPEFARAYAEIGGEGGPAGGGQS